MEKSGFFTSDQHDKIYQSKDLALFFSNLFTNGIFNNSCKVIAKNGMTIAVSKGWALINGYWYYNDSEKELILEQSDGIQSRIDNIVIRYDAERRIIEPMVIQGNYSSSPIAPELVRNNSFYDLRIAKINVVSGIDSITDSLIIDCRFDKNDCGNVIQAVQTPDITGVFDYCYGKIAEIIKNVEGMLSEDVAGNLAKEILAIQEKLIVLDTCSDLELQQAIQNSD